MKKTLLLVLAVCVLSSGCYGPFNLTRKLHKWNGEIGNKYVNEGVFLGLALLHVYTFAALGDVLIFNTVEFWGGKNPVNAASLRLERDGDKVLAYDRASGKLVGAARREGEVAVVTDSSGKVLSRLSPDALAAALPQ